MKALLAALILAASTTFAADAPPAPVQPEVTGVVVIEVDGTVRVIELVYSDGSAPTLLDPKDCEDSPACKAVVQQMVALKRVRGVNIKTGTKV